MTSDNGGSDPSSVARLGRARVATRAAAALVLVPTQASSQRGLGPCASSGPPTSLSLSRSGKASLPARCRGTDTRTLGAPAPTLASAGAHRPSRRRSSTESRGNLVHHHHRLTHT